MCRVAVVRKSPLTIVHDGITGKLLLKEGLLEKGGGKERTLLLWPITAQVMVSDISCVNHLYLLVTCCFLDSEDIQWLCNTTILILIRSICCDPFGLL